MFGHSRVMCVYVSMGQHMYAGTVYMCICLYVYIHVGFEVYLFLAEMIENENLWHIYFYVHLFHLQEYP